MRTELSIRVIHSLPGRLRLRMTVPPRSTRDMIATVRKHPGIHTLSFNPHTRSVLVTYDPAETSQEELIIRLAVYISQEHDLNPVRVFSNINTLEVSQSAFVSGFLILVALFSRVIPRLGNIRNTLDWISGIGTAYSIFNHGYDEYKKRGNFDPEVLSVVYLLSSFSQGKFLPATLFTWIATFGRHLVRFGSQNVEIQPRQTGDASGDKPQYEVAINPINQLPGGKNIFRLLPMMIMRVAVADQGRIEHTLMEEIRQVSKEHGEVLEGFGTFKNGIPIRMHYGQS